MKRKVLLPILMCYISFYAMSADIGKVEFIILDTCVTDNSSVTMLIKNNSNKSYYLPIINTFESDKWFFVIPYIDRDFFFLKKKFCDKNGKELQWCFQWFDDKCIDSGMDEQFFDLWFEERKNFDVHNIIILKSGSSVSIKVPISQIVMFSDFCRWELKDYDYKSALKLSLHYSKRDAKIAEVLLPKKIIEELNQSGTQLYTDEIISNYVTFYPNYGDYSKNVCQKIDSLKKVRDFPYLERIKKHKDIPKGSIQEKYYNYCARNLSCLPRTQELPFFETEKLCSIKNCFSFLSLPEINEIIYKRLVELAKANFKKGIFLYLVAGVGSVDFAEKQNENIHDDDKLIYISVGDIFDLDTVSKGIETYNSETKRLMAR